MIGDGPVGRFRTLLTERMGWTFADTDLPQLARELHDRSGARSLGQNAYLAWLGADGWPVEMAAIAENLTITETYFFRHGEQFRALEREALPDRVAARGAQRVLTMLSVGCSSGEEAYGLAITARAALPDDSWTVSVLGVDTNPAVVRKARAARYGVWSLRETPEAVRRSCFQPCGDDGYEVNATIRADVTFRQQNVTEDDPELWRTEQYDVIFCRNLLMYLTTRSAADLVRRMTLALVPGGYLFLGHTDSLGSRPDGLEARHDHSAFYYRRPPAPPPVPALRPAPSPAAEETTAGPPGPADLNRILALLSEDRFAEALREIGTTDSAEPAVRVAHGMLLAQAGRLAEAQALARAIIDSDGLSADAHHLLAVCLEGGDSVDGAIGQYRLAAYLDPAFAMPRLRLGLIARRRGHDRDGAAELDRALHLMRDEFADRIVLFGGGFGRIALTEVCRSELDASGVRR